MDDSQSSCQAKDEVIQAKDEEIVNIKSPEESLSLTAEQIRDQRGYFLDSLEAKSMRDAKAILMRGIKKFKEETHNQKMGNSELNSQYQQLGLELKHITESLADEHGQVNGLKAEFQQMTDNFNLKASELSTTEQRLAGEKQIVEDLREETKRLRRNVVP